MRQRGRLLSGLVSQSRQPPGYALRLWPSSTPSGRFLDHLGVAAPEHDVIGDEGLFQQPDRAHRFAFPRFLTQLLQTFVAQLVLNDPVIHVGQITQFERQDVIRPDERRPQPGAEAEEKHAPFAAITAERLERGVVDNPHRFPERFGKIKSGPVLAEVFRVCHDFAVPHRGGKSDRDRVEIPIARRILDLLDCLLRRELRAGLKLSPFLLL